VGDLTGSTAVASRVTVAAFEPRHLDAAAELLAARHAAHRTRSPYLPERFADPTVAHVAVEATLTCLTGPGAGAVVALAADGVVGYLAGSVGPDGVGGVQAMAGLASHAVARGLAWPAYRAMYAELASGWHAAGALKHVVVVPAGDEEIDRAFFSLSFGQEQAYALRDIAPASGLGAPPGLVVRQAGLDDLEAIVAVGDVIAEHQARSPVFSTRRVHPVEQLREAHRHELTTPSEQATYFLALDGDEPVGLAIWYPMPASDATPGVPPRCVELAVQQSSAAARGRGVGLALFAAGVEWARSQGYDCIETDWRTTNLLSAQFWPARGFRPTSYRLARYLPVPHA
jgi:GNAT superfamily N-acetyltransferase